MSTTTADTLVSVLDQYRLLEPAQLIQVQKAVQGKTVSAHSLCKDLVNHGWLTAFQTQQLLSGRAADLVLGSYLLLEPLGGGGAGQVFKARHLRMGRVAALKVLRPALGKDNEAVQRFYREIEVASQLSHPNIVHAYEAGPMGAMLVLVMEYVEGIDLEKLVQHAGPLAPAQACEYVRQAALGLQYAHERGLVHRDIKPANLLLSAKASGGRKPPQGKASDSVSSSGNIGSPLASEQVIKILDLGLARLQYHPIGSSTANLTLASGKGVTQGTPDYMSPEQALDFHGADIRSDIYSLGCTLYYLLAGQPPFGGGALTEKLMRHQMKEPPPLSQHRADLPAGLTPILNRMLAKQPADRYQTPGEVAQALAEVLGGLASSRPETVNDTLLSTRSLPALPQLPWRGQSRRRRGLVLLIGGLTASLFVTILWLLSGGSSSQATAVAATPTLPIIPTTRRVVKPTELVQDVKAYNKKPFTTALARLKETCYIDRAYDLTALSSGLQGGLLIRTACDDKHTTGASYVSFTLTAPAVIYVIYDPRSTTLPTWLSHTDWKLTQETASIPVLAKWKVYARTFNAGPVTLGANKQAPAAGTDATYLVVVQPAP
jgi:serine/threonine protein kinase